MDLKGQRVVSHRAGCTKSRIWEDRIKRFVRSPGSRAVEGQRDTKKKTRQRNRQRDRQAGRKDTTARKEKLVLIVGRASPLFLGDTP